MADLYANATAFIRSLSPKFYVALTGTSSVISAIIFVLEWWHYINHGISFIEKMSIRHIGPWVCGGDQNGESTCASLSSQLGAPVECKVWANPMSLFRGAEYQRFNKATNKQSLSYFDLNLSAQEHQTQFTCDADTGKPEYEIMERAWRERDPQARIKAAKEAIEINPHCAPAYVLLAEEEATTILEVEKLMKQALRTAELSHKLLAPDSAHRRDTNVVIHCRRRLAMCARRLGKLKEAVKVFKELTKEIPPIMNMLNIHENLIEALLEMRAYADVQAVIAKYDDISLAKSATVVYTAALLKTRGVADKFSSEIASKRGLTTAEMTAVEAIKRAIDFNPHAPKYMLEMKALILPPEHVLRRGDSEAISYSFFNLRHWKAVPGALNMLQATWEGSVNIPSSPGEEYLYFPYPSCTQCTDRQLLPAYHKVSIYPSKGLPFFLLFTAGLTAVTATIAISTHLYPDDMTTHTKEVIRYGSMPFNFLMEKVDALVPSNIMQQLTRI